MGLKPESKGSGTIDLSVSLRTSDLKMPVEKILIAVDPDSTHDALIDAVLDITGPTSASAVLWVNHTEDAYVNANKDYDGRASPDELAKRNREVQKFIERFEQEGVCYEIQGIVDESGKEFVSLGEDLDADRLFIQGQSRSPTGKALFGSTAQTILLNAHCPVTFVRR